jgi:outer membrane protein assembly factor BamB
MNILTPVIHGNSVLTSTHRHGTYLFRISGAGEQYESRQIWQNKVQGYMSSPVVVDGHAYLHLGNGRLACLDLASGTESWISKPFGKYWSLAVQQEKLLALDAGGELFLLRANPRELEVLDSRQIAAQSTWGHLAVSGNEIFVRELEAVTAYRWTDESESDQVTARASMKMQQRPYAPAD